MISFTYFYHMMVLQHLANSSVQFICESVYEIKNINGMLHRMQRQELQYACFLSKVFYQTDDFCDEL